MLKFSFPVDVEAPTATYETPYGNIVRDTNGNEEPGQRWIDLTGNRSRGDAYGLTVFNDAKYGYSVNGSEMRISVVRSSPYAHHMPKVLDMNSEHIWMDQGMQTFRMLLVPHSGYLEKSEHTKACRGIHFTRHWLFTREYTEDTMPKSGSFLSVNSGESYCICCKAV